MEGYYRYIAARDFAESKGWCFCYKHFLTIVEYSHCGYIAVVRHQIKPAYWLI